MLWPGRTGRTGTWRQKRQRDFIARDKEGICTEIFLMGESVVKSKFPRLSPQVTVVQEPIQYGNLLKVKWPPLRKGLLLYFPSLYLFFPGQGVEGRTAVESRAAKENLFLRRGAGPALIYNTPQHPLFSCFPSPPP